MLTVGRRKTLQVCNSNLLLLTNRSFLQLSVFACLVPANDLPCTAEPRHTPTPVAFFSTRAGGRVRSVAGGRSYSAAVTADGRVLKWGLNRKPASSLKNEHHRHVAVARACGRRNDRTEEDGVGAVEAFTPRLVAGLGVEVWGSASFSCKKILSEASIQVAPRIDDVLLRSGGWNKGVCRSKQIEKDRLQGGG